MWRAMNACGGKRRNAPIVAVRRAHSDPEFMRLVESRSNQVLPFDINW
jgi:hypothetical protein